MAEDQSSKPYSDWAREKSTPPWKLEAARVGNNWPEGREMSEAEFDKAISRVETEEIR